MCGWCLERRKGWCVMMRDRECPKCAPWVGDGDGGGGGPDYAQIGGGHAGMPDDEASLAQVMAALGGFVTGFVGAALVVILLSMKGCVV